MLSLCLPPQPAPPAPYQERVIVLNEVSGQTSAACAEIVTLHAQACDINLFHVTVVRVIALATLASRSSDAAYGCWGTQQKLR